MANKKRAKPCRKWPKNHPEATWVFVKCVKTPKTRLGHFQTHALPTRLYRLKRRFGPGVYAKPVFNRHENARLCINLLTFCIILLESAYSVPKHSEVIPTINSLKRKNIHKWFTNNAKMSPKIASMIAETSAKWFQHGCKNGCKTMCKTMPKMVLCIVPLARGVRRDQKRVLCRKQKRNAQPTCIFFSGLSAWNTFTSFLVAMLSLFCPFFVPSFFPGLFSFPLSCVLQLIYDVLSLQQNTDCSCQHSAMHWRRLWRHAMLHRCCYFFSFCFLCIWQKKWNETQKVEQENCISIFMNQREAEAKCILSAFVFLC